jgi:asparagine synthase (glutamine-hydrolysing)
LEEASETICKLLSASIGYVSASSNRVGILFSGGLDSSVVATAATNAGLKPRLYTAAFPGSTDVKTAEKSAKTLGLDLNLTVVTGDKAEDTVKRTVWAVESSDPLQVCVALPLNIAAEAAVECGERVLLTGSGCDELFGGYARYLQLGSYEELSNALIKDVLRLGEREFARDAAIGEANGVHIYTPFAYLDLVNFALSLHPIYKIDNQAEEPRKRVLRLSARRLGIPAEISDLPKKAAQYSSGSLKAVQKLAKAHGLNTWGYLSLVFNEVFSGLRRM